MFLVDELMDDRELEAFDFLVGSGRTVTEKRRSRRFRLNEWEKIAGVERWNFENRPPAALQRQSV
jgi:hypothetical protein